ncbi:hypothetical protein FA13DRAFT_1711759 [Coprinellus micaceus]|uniref:Uncharacterized protein n=1 Tax=Coprinellus micaceus TaxID=71717 RepID=A0A4Y7T3F0_COPMI|nr:hypothetical protein FA13DRAFT_1711759 [Coprinellus micaceus]
MNVILAISRMNGRHGHPLGRCPVVVPANSVPTSSAIPVTTTAPIVSTTVPIVTTAAPTISTVSIGTTTVPTISTTVPIVTTNVPTISTTSPIVSTTAPAVVSPSGVYCYWVPSSTITSFLSTSVTATVIPTTTTWLGNGTLSVWASFTTTYGNPSFTTSTAFNTGTVTIFSSAAGASEASPTVASSLEGVGTVIGMSGPSKSSSGQESITEAFHSGSMTIAQITSTVFSSSVATVYPGPVLTASVSGSSLVCYPFHTSSVTAPVTTTFHGPIGTPSAHLGVPGKPATSFPTVGSSSVVTITCTLTPTSPSVVTFTKTVIPTIKMDLPVT